MLSDPGANAALSPDDLPKDLFTPGSHLHISGYTLLNEGSRGATLAAFSPAQRAGMTVSVDGASAAPLERLGAEPFLQLTNGATLLFVNGDQAPGAHRPRPARAGRPGAERLVPAGGHEARRRGRAVLRQRAARSRSGFLGRRSSGSWTGPGPATRSALGSCPPGWTRSPRARRWPAAAASRPGRSAWWVPARALAAERAAIPRPRPLRPPCRRLPHRQGAPVAAQQVGEAVLGIGPDPVGADHNFLSHTANSKPVS